MGESILVIGSGGREHAISKKIAESLNVDTVYCAPGNPGMTRDNIEIVAISETNHSDLITFVKEKNISWTFVGPEVPLLNGIVDDFEREGLRIFGPRKNAAIIEGSKEFAKELMINYLIPTAEYQSFTDYDLAKAYVESVGVPIVIKADGLAAGKGVVVAETMTVAISALQDMLQDNKFGTSGAKVVIEEFLEGEEFSLLAFVNGEAVYPMIIAQDHKRAYDGDNGPNTGGMGAYSPVSHIPEKIVEEAVQTILIPAAKGMVKEGHPFTGILYAGLIGTQGGPKVIEFNARFGDPETQVVLPRLESDFAQIISDVMNGDQPTINWKQDGVTLGVVVAADGYPERYEKGKRIPDFSDVPDVTVYYAGVSESNHQLVTNGGRVYLLETTGETIQDAQSTIYDALHSKDTSGTFYRRDIGSKAIS